MNEVTSKFIRSQQNDDLTAEELSFLVKYDKDKSARPRIPESILESQNPKEAVEKYLSQLVDKYYVNFKQIDRVDIDPNTKVAKPFLTNEEKAKLEVSKGQDKAKLLGDFQNEYGKALEKVKKENRRNPLTAEEESRKAMEIAAKRWNSQNLYGDRKADEKNKADDKQKVFVKGKNDVSDIDLNDVVQGDTGNCFLLAAIGAVAKQHPELIKNAIKDNGNGTFDVKIYKPDLLGNYVETTQTVDGKLIGDGHAKYGDIEEISGKEQRESWVVLMEKAYIQANGSYDDVSRGGKTNEVLSSLLGKDVNVSKDYKTDDLATLLSSGKSVVMNTPSLDSFTNRKLKDKFENTYKLVPTHSYVLQEIKKSKQGNDIAVLYNPHGKNHAEIPLSDLKAMIQFVVSEK